MHPLASETILSAKAISLKRQGNERENKMRDTTSDDMFESYSSCLQNTSFPKGKKVRKRFHALLSEIPQLISSLLKDERIKDSRLAYHNNECGIENQGRRNLPEHGEFGLRSSSGHTQNEIESFM